MNQPTSSKNKTLLFGASFFVVVSSTLGLFYSIDTFILNAFQPLKESLFKIDDASNDLIASLTDLQNRAAIENKLQLQLVELSTKLNDAEEKLKDLRSVEKQYSEIESNLKKRFISAKVLQRDYNLPGSLRVQTNQEVKVGDYVFSYGYLIGRVVMVSENFTEIILINSTDSNIPVYVDNESAVGELIGHAGIEFLVQGLDPRRDIRLGSKVRLYLPSRPLLHGRIVGEVKEINGVEADPTRELVVNTPIDLAALQIVLILRFD